MTRPTLRHPSLKRSVFTGLLYFAVASLALLTSRFEGGLAFIWGANALLMAEMMTARMRAWPHLLISCMIASTIATALFGMGPLAAVPMAFINAGEALVVAYICRRMNVGLQIAGSMRELSIFVVALAGVANILAGIAAGLVVAILLGGDFPHVWLQWYSGHVLGGLICTPLLLILLQGEVSRWARQARPVERLEAFGLLAAFALCAWWIFYRVDYPMLFASLLPLVLIAFRTGYAGSAAAIVILALIGGTATMTGHGPLRLVAASIPERIQFFQFYLALSFLLSVPVAAELNSRRRLIRMLRDSEARYRAFAEHSGDGVINLSIDGIIQYVSPSAVDQIGIDADRLLGQPAVDLIDPEYRPFAIVTHRRALAHPGEAHAVEFRPNRPDNDFDWYEMLVRAVLDEQGRAIGVISTVRDISRHKARQRALHQAAAQDALTGADSRRALQEKLDDQIARVAAGGRACLLLIDIDHFKSVNDRHGHAAGDRVLVGFVERLRQALRGTGSIGRLGGEEFAVLLPDVDLERAERICEHLRTRVGVRPFPLGNGEDIAITFSAGLVELDGSASAATLMEAADKALYAAKGSGRNCLRFAA